MNADDGAQKPEPVGHGAEGATALAGNLGNGETLGTIKTKDGEEARGIRDLGGIEAVENLECEQTGWKAVNDGRGRMALKEFHILRLSVARGVGHLRSYRTSTEILETLNELNGKIS